MTVEIRFEERDESFIVNCPRYYGVVSARPTVAIEVLAELIALGLADGDGVRLDVSPTLAEEAKQALRMARMDGACLAAASLIVRCSDAKIGATLNELADGYRRAA
jgi:hypothetical protein